MMVDETLPMVPVRGPSVPLGETVLERYRVDGFVGHRDGWEVYDGSATGKVTIRVARMQRMGGYLSFLLDARRLIQIRHLNVVPMFAEGTIGDRAVVVSEHMTGTDLGVALALEGPLPWPHVVKLGVGMLGGLAALHGAGIVHRALTPASVLLGPKGIAKIWDTGLGYVRTRAAINLPEHDLSERYGVRADVYAAGLILYRALAGAGPFGDASFASIRRRLLEPIPPPRVPADRPPPPRPIVDVILSALAVDPAERPTSAIAFADKLRPFI
jgi:serine/threonine-protein kinase